MISSNRGSIYNPTMKLVVTAGTDKAKTRQRIEFAGSKCGLRSDWGKLDLLPARPALCGVDINCPYSPEIPVQNDHPK